jgi:signal transduction histidine kinase
VNLVKNSVEAMPSGGRIRLILRESLAEPGVEPSLTLNVEDNGPGIPREALESIFEPGYTTRSKADAANGKAGWRCEHRGLGLSITRSIVEAAGGRIQAANRDPSGTCFQIELPVRIS